MDADQFQQFLQLQRQCAAANSHKLREFNGEGDTATTWRRWRHNFLLAVEINHWGNARARNELASNMTSKAKSATAHIPIDANDANPVADLLQQYDAVFMPQANTTYLRIELAQACQKHDESILEWHNRCRELHQRAHDRPIGYNWDADVQLRDDFIRGLSSKKFKEGVMNRRPQTYQEALAHAHEAYAVDRALNPKPNGASASVSAITQPRQSPLRCHHCQRPGHFIRNCRDKANGLPRTPPGAAAGSRPRNSPVGNRGGSRGGQRGRGGRGGRSRGGRGRGISRGRFVAAINAIEELYQDAQAAQGHDDSEKADVATQQSLQQQDTLQHEFAEAYGGHYDEAVDDIASNNQGNE